MKAAAIVLAAGAGTRFGGDKLAALFRGEPLLYHAISAARAAPVARVIVVASPGLETGMWPGEPRVETVVLTSSALSVSLCAGLQAASDCDAAFIFLGDMPMIPHYIAERLSSLLPGHFAAIPKVGTRLGHPVLLSREAMNAAQHLCGDEGAGKLLRSREDVAFLAVEDDAVLQDVDRIKDLIRLEAGGEQT